MIRHLTRVTRIEHQAVPRGGQAVPSGGPGSEPDKGHEDRASGEEQQRYGSTRHCSHVGLVVSSAHLLISSSLHHFIASSPHLLMRRCEPVVPSPSIVIHPDSLPQRKWRRWIGRRAETESRMMQQERSFWKKGVLYKEVAFLSGCPLVVTLASSPLHPRFIPASSPLYARSILALSLSMGTAAKKSQVPKCMGDLFSGRKRQHPR